MSKGLISSRPSRIFVFPLSALLLLVACGKQSDQTSTEKPQQQAPVSASISSDGLPAAPSDVVSLPLGFTRDTSDLDQMAKRRQIRALVIINPIGFFYDKGQ